MKCPVCKERVNELDEVCPNCKTNFDEYEQHVKTNTKEFKSTNADRLNVMANINIILSIISAIVVWVKFSKLEVVTQSTYKNYSSGYYTDTVINWYGIVGGIAILIAGFTLFFLLKTIVDIYSEVEKQ